MPFRRAGNLLLPFASNLASFDLQSLAWFGKDDVSSKECLARWVTALAKCTMCNLRGTEHELKGLLGDTLRPNELLQLEGSHSR